VLKGFTRIVDPGPSFQMRRLNIVTYRLWRHQIMWRRWWRHQSTRHRHFPI